MNNLSSYCGLVDAKIRASDKDLPVQRIVCTQNQSSPRYSEFYYHGTIILPCIIYDCSQLGDLLWFDQKSFITEKTQMDQGNRWTTQCHIKNMQNRKSTYKVDEPEKRSRCHHNLAFH